MNSQIIAPPSISIGTTSNKIANISDDSGSFLMFNSKFCLSEALVILDMNSSDLGIVNEKVSFSS